MAVPMLDELENLPLMLDRLRAQTFRQFTLYCCVNNLEGGYGFEANQKSLDILRQVDDLPVVIIDRSSPGLGWSGKQRGVGWARKLLFQKIQDSCSKNELIVSLDADTDFSPTYFKAVLDSFNAHPDASAFAVPYYHPLSGDDAVDRPMLRYECYMRHYLLQLLRIRSPYAFTALGSAMAFPLWAYIRVGGITPLQGGEDFYLMQKFAKTGHIFSHFSKPHDGTLLAVRPQGRISSRVPFGTGPAIAHGIAIMDQSYPFYSSVGFDAVRQTYDLLPELYVHDIPTPLTEFLCQQLSTTDLWGPLRQNFNTQDRFIHACHERIDGLRILQYLKSTPGLRLPSAVLPVDFEHDAIEIIQDYRQQLFSKEMELRNQE